MFQGKGAESVETELKNSLETGSAGKRFPPCLFTEEISFKEGRWECRDGTKKQSRNGKRQEEISSVFLYGGNLFQGRALGV